MSFVTRRKSMEPPAAHDGHSLIPTLGWPHLVALGVGAIIGTGIYTLTGVAAGLAGPAVILSFALAGAVCAFAALCYAEMSTMMPQAGSAYTYSYVGMGELAAWVVGWSLILEYTVVCSTVAVGWSGYAGGLMQQAGWAVPQALLAGPHAGGIINVPAIFITLVVTALLLVGTRESATINFILVIVKIVALAAFVALTIPAFDAANFEPFAPFGFGAVVDSEGVKRGVAAAAGIIFFAFYGFDAISTAAEETKNPGRDLTIGIIGSMVACTAIYMIVATAALGASPFDVFSKSPEPLSFILRGLGHPQVAAVVAGAAVVALPTVIMVFMFGQSRIFFAMARDGLLPRGLSKVGSRGVPAPVIILTGVVAASIAGFLPLDEIAALANAGTLLAFIATAIAMMLMRRRAPDLPRPFRTPLWWFVGPAAVVGCLYLFTTLPASTLINFLIWNAIGVAAYLAYGRVKSRLANA
ncbi:amino acid permease [Phenylobacterium sp. Root77]|uniref:amino acid permease n=1 Tax=unclassified Phenylobacterium TaxID=2640670 RepID=UPI0006FF8BB8|nr:MULTISPECIES: amino acid permease [unclassified Phenylobacterium]KQW70951.1 amino acid permease [Phenylobacterium sp. Root1277]KQW95891.1 amino acid permease [Phenylobacterium sp. Root1290]KRC41676.1 amino acid permease [Phenylobacterium sp. Root77]